MTAEDARRIAGIVLDEWALAWDRTGSRALGPEETAHLRAGIALVLRENYALARSIPVQEDGLVPRLLVASGALRALEGYDSVLALAGTHRLIRDTRRAVDAAASALASVQSDAMQRVPSSFPWPVR